MVRELTVTEDGSWSFDGEVVARATPATQVLLEPILENTRVRASSTYRDEPSLGAQLAFDGDPVSFWAASPGDPRPTLRLRWPHRRDAHLPRRRRAARDGRGARPRGAAGQRRADPRGGPDGGTGDVRADAHPAAGDQVRRADTVGLAARGSGRARAGEPRGPDPPHRPRPQTGAVCGLGPELVVDGRVYPTAVTGTLGAVLDGTPLTVHRLRVARAAVRRHPPRAIRATEQYTATRLTLRPGGARRRARARCPIATWTCAAGRPAGESSTWRPARAPPGAPENVNAGWRATLDGHRAHAGAGRRLDAGLPAARGRRRPGDAGVRPQPALPSRARSRGGCWPCCCWDAAVVVGRRETAFRAAAATPAARLPCDDRGPGAGGCRRSQPGRCWAVRRSRPGCCWATSADAGSATPARSAPCWSAPRRWPRASWRPRSGLQLGMPPTWCDALAGAGIGLVAAMLMTRPRRTTGDLMAERTVWAARGRAATLELSRGSGCPGPGRRPARLARGAPGPRLLHPGRLPDAHPGRAARCRSTCLQTTRATCSRAGS